MKLNIANKLTLARIVLVPFFAFFIIYPVFTYEHTTWSRIIAAAIFILAAITDFLDGKIARKKQIITHVGKFMDPLADKFMIFGALIAICASDFIIADDLTVPHWLLYNVFLWSTLAVVFRELAVTSMRLVVSRESGVVVAANMLGKIKTVSQFVCIIVVLLEPIVFPTGGFLSLFSMVIMVVFTIWSGVHYIRQYWNFLDPSV